MVEIQGIANFLNRVELRKPDAIIVDDTAAYLQEFAKFTEGRDQYLIDAVPDGYSFPDFENRGTVTNSETEGLLLHRNREVEPIDDVVTDQLRESYGLNNLEPRTVSIPVDAWNSIEVTIPSTRYCRETDFQTFSNHIDYNEVEGIAVSKDHEEFLPDSYESLKPTDST